MGRKSSIIAGLDIGTTKTSCIIGDYGEDGVEIIGFGCSQSQGMRRGEVINPEATCHTILEAIHEAQLMAGCSIENVIVGIGGSHVYGINSDGMVPLRERVVTEASLHSVIEAASAIPEIQERAVIHVIPQSYLVNYMAVNRKPVGIKGVRLDTTVHVVSAAKDSCDNIRKCVESCGLRVEKMVADQVASSYAVASKQEKELGVAVVDIGGGTTDIALYVDGALVHTHVIPLGGNHVTNDIVKLLNCSPEDSEILKKTQAGALPALEDRARLIDVPTVGNRAPRKLHATKLACVVEARLMEIFALVGSSIENSGFRDQLGAGMIITGGTSQMRNLPQLVLKYQKTNGVRCGSPRGKIGGLVDVVEDPQYATGVGLVLYAVENEDFAARQKDEPKTFFAKCRDGFRSLW